MMQNHTDILSTAVERLRVRIEMLANFNRSSPRRHALVVAQPQVALTQLKAGADDLVPVGEAVTLLQCCSGGREFLLLPQRGGARRCHSRAALLKQNKKCTDYYINF